jgi:hypothetical protein
LDYLRIWDLVEEVQLSHGIPDKLCWRWSSDKEYSVASAYGAMFVGSTRLVRLSLSAKSASHSTVFFSHNKPTNSTFSYGLLAKQTGRPLGVKLL